MRSIETGRTIRTLGRIGGTAVIAGAAVFGADLLGAGGQEPTADAGGGSTTRRVSCKRADAWYPLRPTQTLVVRANAVVLPSDVKVNGVAQYDTDPNTSTVAGMYSKDSETIRVTNDYGGSAHVLKCGASRDRFYEDLGRQTAILDARVQKNNPEKRVNVNVIFK